MNEPLEHKLFTVYGQLLNTKILARAWDHVRKNKGCAGIDKVTVSQFESNLGENLQDMLTELKEKSYKPSPVRRKYVPKKNGKKRPLGIPTIKDRIIQQALVYCLQDFFEENVFHDNSCGFRPNRDAKLALKKIICRLDAGYRYIYDFDIKGFFDHVPHKKLMRVLTKYISDGSVLNMIWKWLKAGYMEDEIPYETPQGLQQGGVISPLLANIYLNELDWELDKNDIEFVRYADDCICMCKSRAELEKAKEIVHRVMLELGLELAEDKTKDVDFHKDDFDFLGFTFEHIRRAKKSGKLYYILKPQDSSLKKFKDEMKQKIKKSYTFSNEQWCDILNSIIRGKFNYFLLAYRAMCGVNGAYKDRGLDCRSMCRVQTKCFKDIDGYIRNRLRINLGNRGKRHAGCLDGKMLTVKYDNKFFLTHFGLVSGEYLLFTLQRAEKGFPQTRFEDFLAYKANTKQKAKRTPERERFFQYALAR